MTKADNFYDRHGVDISRKTPPKPVEPIEKVVSHRNVYFALVAERFPNNNCGDLVVYTAGVDGVQNAPGAVRTPEQLKEWAEAVIAFCNEVIAERGQA